MTDLPITAIKIGGRRREDMGDIDGLAASIRDHNLFHPVVVDDCGNLIAGHRRLLAMQSLGWTMIPTRSLGELSDDEKREIELEENLRRKDLTAFERSKAIVQFAAIVVENGHVSLDVAERSAGPNEVPFQPGRLPGQGVQKVMGRPPEATARETVGPALGVSGKTVERAQQHVETADAYPFMQSPDWKQDHVLEARQHLAALPEPDRAPAAALVSQPGVPPQEAVKILGHLRHAEPDEREDIYRKAESTDIRDRWDALSAPAGKPAMPDPRVVMFGGWLRELTGWNKAIADEFTDRCKALGQTIEGLQREIREARSA